VPRCSGDAVAGVFEQRVAVGVALAGADRGVPGSAVGLDDEALVAPEEVDLERLGSGGDIGVDLGPGEALLAAEREEALLHSLVWQRPLEVTGIGEDLTELLRAAAAVGPPEHILDGLEIEQLHRHGLVHSTVERIEGDDVGKVEQGAGDGGARNAVVIVMSAAVSVAPLWTRMPP